jgi:hypothetical protein
LQAKNVQWQLVCANVFGLRWSHCGTKVSEPKAFELKQNFRTVDCNQGIDNWVKVLRSMLPVMGQSFPPAAVPNLIAVFARKNGIFGGHVLNASWISRLGLSVVDGEVVDSGLNLRCALEANPQLRGEHSDIGLEENLFMATGELMGFRAAREQFTPPEIGIATGQDWPILAAENGRGTGQWFRLGKTRLQVGEFLRVYSAELTHAKLESKGNVG